MSETFPQCTQRLRAKGLAYPRTCRECGLGPCKVFPTSKATDPRDAEIERLTRERDEAREWSCKQAEDIVTLGNIAGRTLTAEAALSAALAEIERLREALKLLHDNIVQAFPSLTNLGPVAQARAALSPTPPEK